MRDAQRACYVHKVLQHIALAHAQIDCSVRLHDHLHVSTQFSDKGALGTVSPDKAARRPLLAGVYTWLSMRSLLLLHASDQCYWP